MIHCVLLDNRFVIINFTELNSPLRTNARFFHEEYQDGFGPVQGCIANMNLHAHIIISLLPWGAAIITINSYETLTCFPHYASLIPAPSQS